MTAPIINTPKHQYSATCTCDTCTATFIAKLRASRALQYGYTEPPRMRWRSIIAALAFMLLAVLIASLIVFLAFSDPAHAREGAIHPVPIPAAHAKARAKCPLDKPLQCRAALVHAYEAVSWQQKARTADAKRAQGYGVMHALRLASGLYNVPLSELIQVGTCESHLHPTSKNSSSTASGLFQFLDSTWNRAGIPGFSVFDAYANALAAARLVQTDGSWREWSCAP